MNITWISDLNNNCISGLAVVKLKFLWLLHQTPKLWGQGTIWYVNVIRLGHRRREASSWNLKTTILPFSKRRNQNIFYLNKCTQLLRRSLNNINFSLLKEGKNVLFIFSVFFIGFSQQFPNAWKYVIHIRFCIPFSSAVFSYCKSGPAIC